MPSKISLKIQGGPGRMQERQKTKKNDKMGEIRYVDGKSRRIEG